MGSGHIAPWLISVYYNWLITFEINVGNFYIVNYEWYH